jgi:alkylation response protein AidB-like acyl-CoA dehydrogenase
MRGTVSRNLLFDDVFVAETRRSCRAACTIQAATRWPHMFLTLSPTYMGLAQAAYDFTVAYLRGEWPGAPVKRRMYPTKQIAVAQMRIMLEQYQGPVVPGHLRGPRRPQQGGGAARLCRPVHVMENANELARLAMRTCGGQAMLKSLPLERIYRDSRCGSLMLPWTAEICLDRIGRD